MQSDLHSDVRKGKKYDPFSHILRIKYSMKENPFRDMNVITVEVKA